jgi:hypothetical protein
MLSQAPARGSSSPFRPTSFAPRASSRPLDDVAEAGRGESGTDSEREAPPWPVGWKRKKARRLRKESLFPRRRRRKEREEKRKQSAPCSLSPSSCPSSTHLHRRHGHGRESQPSGQLVGVHILCKEIIGGGERKLSESHCRDVFFFLPPPRKWLFENFKVQMRLRLRAPVPPLHSLHRRCSHLCRWSRKRMSRGAGLTLKKGERNAEERTRKIEVVFVIEEEEKKKRKRERKKEKTRPPPPLPLLCVVFAFFTFFFKARRHRERE